MWEVLQWQLMSGLLWGVHDTTSLVAFTDRSFIQSVLVLEFFLSDAAVNVTLLLNITIRYYCLNNLHLSIQLISS